jgi:DNA-binding response OmpR family regulator
MLTARGEEADLVLGLETGADDYVAKPFSSRELLARIRAQVRRARGGSGPRAELLTVGPLKLDTASREVTLRGKTISVTSYEFSLLRALAERPGRVLSREQIMDLARGTADEAFDRSIDVHVSRLRQKLESDPRHPSLLKTIRGLGYMLVDGHLGDHAGGDGGAANDGANGDE